MWFKAMNKKSICTLISLSCISLSGIFLDGCSESVGVKTEPVTMEAVTAWCKSKNDLPIFPNSEARTQSTQGPFEARTIWNPSPVKEVDEWYMKVFEGPNWSNYGLWKRDAEATIESAPSKFFFLTDGNLEISISLAEQAKGTLILMSASPHDSKAETHLENVYKCIRPSKNPTKVIIDK